MFFYAYKVKYYEEGEIIEQGFVCGNSYSDAMTKVIAAFGEEGNILDIALSAIDTPEFLLPMSAQTFEAVISEQC